MWNFDNYLRIKKISKLLKTQCTLLQEPGGTSYSRLEDKDLLSLQEDRFSNEKFTEAQRS